MIMNPIAEDILMHYGIKRRSGRYPWGSGEDPYQHGNDFLGRVEEMRKTNFTYTDNKGKTWSGDTAIAKSMGLTSTQFRTELGIAANERRMLQVARAKSLREDGLGATEIGRMMGVNESTVRSWFNEESESRMKEAQTTADFLRKRSQECIADGGMIDVGAGVNLELNVSKERLDQALYILEREGYHVYGGRIPQATNPDQKTTQKVLCPPGTKHGEIYDFSRVHTVKEYISRDGGETYEKKFTYPSSLDSKRMKIRYMEDGGIDKDGVIELRRGVKDLSLGESRYSQVRILVDGTHYLKGMAVYSDKMPDGVDVIFNTNKKKGTPMEKVLKEIKDDPDNPFGSAIKDAELGGQYWYDPKTGKHVTSSTPGAKLGLINKRADEGDWTDWKDALPSQFLGKQNINLAKKQLNLAKVDKLAEYDEICKLENPTIKKHMLQKFADSCDSAAVHLQAAALPGQKYHVIIPINSLKDNEVYAPNYETGTKLALIRYPHGGTFEIPILTVNNRNRTGKEIIGNTSIDAVGITSKVAERLSGADFDGDTVMCIPTHDAGGKVKITSTPPLKGLEGFDPKIKYGPETYTGRDVKLMSKKGTQKEMGVISNLITDMTLGGASDDELAAAVRHSMVVIDAHKHKLDYKQSALDNNITALHAKYQGKPTGGAATILSRSKGQTSVPKRQGTPKVNKKGDKDYDPTKPEGALLYKLADDLEYTVTKVNKRTGEVTTQTKQRMQKSTKMAEEPDAMNLVSKARHPMELVYADYANSMKALANQARKEMVYTGKIEYSAEAKRKYAQEVSSLNDKLKTALLNAPRERAAQRLARAEVDEKKKSGLLTENDQIKKASQQAISKYRDEVGGVTRKKRNIEITDKEWEAIQAGAISESRLKDILNNTDIDKLRERATPRATTTVSPSQISRIKAFASSNYSLEEIASKLGLSTSTVSKYLKGGT
jgi:DNA-binding CsgD family transcriptional regulator